MQIKVVNQGVNRGPTVRASCPACGRDGTFERIGVDDIQVANTLLGQRRCPNDQCHAHIFFIYQGTELKATFPPQRIDFDKEGVPVKVLNAFEEAITCHAQECYIASAIMIRRTLEEICEDRGGSGDTLKQRIEALSDKILVPKELLEGMDLLRILGNDATHVKAKVFTDIGDDQVSAGIEFTKEILKAVYQYKHLLKRLKSLKKEETDTGN